jgi:glycerate kinase
LLGGERKSGLSALFEERGYEERLQNADAVLCGEGLLDGTSFTGKVIGKIAELCEKYGKPLYLICGDAEPFLPLPSVVSGVYKLTDITPVIAECICRAQEFYENRLLALLNDIAPLPAKE